MGNQTHQVSILRATRAVIGTPNLLSLGERDTPKESARQARLTQKETRIATRDPMTGPENAPSVLGFNTSAAKNSGGGKRPKPLQIPYSILLQEVNFFQLVGPCPTERPGRPQKTAPPVMGFRTSRRHGSNAKAKTPNPPTPPCGARASASRWTRGPARGTAREPPPEHRRTAAGLQQDNRRANRGASFFSTLLGAWLRS